MNDSYPKSFSVIATIVVVVILGFILYRVLTKDVVVPVPNYTENPNPALCLERAMQTTLDGQVRTCIDGKWIYTGENGDIKG